MKVTMKTNDALRLAVGLAAIINGGPNGPWRLDAYTAMRIRMTHKSARSAAEVFEEAKAAAIKEFSGGKDKLEPEDVGYSECKERVDELLAVECEVEVFKVDAEKILEKNEAFPLPIFDMIEVALNEPAMAE